jgi:hypothetical protein
MTKPEFALRLRCALVGPALFKPVQRNVSLSGLRAKHRDSDLILDKRPEFHLRHIKVCQRYRSPMLSKWVAGVLLWQAILAPVFANKLPIVSVGQASSDYRLTAVRIKRSATANNARECIVERIGEETSILLSK